MKNKCSVRHRRTKSKIVQSSLINGLILQLGTHGSNLTEEELDTHTISAWKEAKLYMNRQSNEHGSAFSSQLVQVTVFCMLISYYRRISKSNTMKLPNLC